MTSLLGLSVRLPNTCHCASDTTTIGDANVLICHGCQRRRGVLSTLTADFVQQVASKFGAPEIITIRAPRVSDASRNGSTAGAAGRK
jgi:hypothetical protein